jgi:hypothetical protein
MPKNLAGTTKGSGADFLQKRPLGGVYEKKEGRGKSICSRLSYINYNPVVKNSIEAYQARCASQYGYSLHRQLGLVTQGDSSP